MVYLILENITRHIVTTNYEIYLTELTCRTPGGVRNGEEQESRPYCQKLSKIRELLKSVNTRDHSTDHIVQELGEISLAFLLLGILKSADRNRKWAYSNTKLTEVFLTVSRFFNRLTIWFEGKNT